MENFRQTQYCGNDDRYSGNNEQLRPPRQHAGEMSASGRL
jgi:hypothetical protein